MQVTYGPEESLAVFVATVIGGLGSLTGAVIGALFQRGCAVAAARTLVVPGHRRRRAGRAAAPCPTGWAGRLFRIRDRFLRWAARRNHVSSLALDRTHQEDRTALSAAAAVAEPAAEPPADGDGAGEGAEPAEVSG